LVSKEQRREAKIEKILRESRAQERVAQGGAEILSRNVGGRRAEVAAERAGSERARPTGPREELSLAARKAIARQQRKGKRLVRPQRVPAGEAWKYLKDNKDVPVSKTAGTPDVPVHQAEWFHGTQSNFEGVPTAKGKFSDLGVYPPSDPSYARGYAGHSAGRVIPVRIKPRKVLDWRAGRANQSELADVAERLVQMDDASKQGTRIGPSFTRKEVDRKLALL